MDAEEFWSVYEAVEDSTRTLQLAVRDPCPINKVVWSSFDYMNGPELCFVWEPLAASSLTPVELASNSDCSRETSNSLTSSISKATSTNTYEDIDNAFNEDLLSCAIAQLDVCATCLRTHSGVLCDSMISSVSGVDASMLTAGESLHYLDEFMSDSRSTLGTKTSTTIGDDEESRLLTSFASTSEMGESQSTDGTSGTSDDGVARPTQKSGKFEAVAYAEDALISRNEYFPNTPQDLSILLDSERRAPTKRSNLADFGDSSTEKTSSKPSSVSTSATVLTRSSSFSTVSEDGTPMGPSAIVTKETTACEDTQVMMASNVDSGIAGTISTHSDLSACLVQSPDVLESSQKTDGLTSSQKADEGYSETLGKVPKTDSGFDEMADYQVLEAVSGENSLELSDEQFIAKTVLAEQICSTQLPSNPLHHKLTVVPKRDLVSGSFMFPVVRRNAARRAMCALSFLMRQSKLDWYLERQTVIETMIEDVLPRVKALHLIESFHDIIIRVMGEVIRILSVLGAAERFPLYHPVEEVKLRRTHLLDCGLGDNNFIARSITALLRSQAHCVLVGDRNTDIAKMLNTLSVFVADEWRWGCVKAYAHSYSPYLRLQAVHRSELKEVLRLGVESSWPISVIDLDKKVVCVSSRYAKHCKLKEQRQREQIVAILQHKEDTLANNTAESMLKLEMRGCRPDIRVVELLKHMDLLAQDQGVRHGFVKQFMLGLENRARALIAYVKDVSAPKDGDKRHATSSKWSLQSARKALDLFSDSSFATVLAEAERIQPDIAPFIFQCNNF